MKAKYIRTEYGFLVFSDENTHKHIARSVEARSGCAESAGFVCADEAGKLVCFGESVSLGLESEPDDTDRLREFLGIKNNAEDCEDVTDKVDFQNNDDESLPLTKCVCGERFPAWSQIVSIYN